MSIERLATAYASERGIDIRLAENTLLTIARRSGGCLSCAYSASPPGGDWHKRGCEMGLARDNCASWDPLLEGHTTFRIARHLYERARVRAAEEGVSVKCFISKAILERLEREIAGGAK